MSEGKAKPKPLDWERFTAVPGDIRIVGKPEPKKATAELATNGKG